MWCLPQQTPTAMPPSLASPLVFIHKLSPNLLSILYQRSLHSSCYFMQGTPPPAHLELSFLPIFPEEFVLDHCRSPAVSCPSTSQFFPVFLLAKRLLLHFARWIPLLSFSAFEEVPVFVNSKSPSMTQLLYKVLTYRIGLPLPKPHP